MWEVDCGKQSSHIPKSNNQLNILVRGYYFITWWAGGDKYKVVSLCLNQPFLCKLIALRMVQAPGSVTDISSFLDPTI